MSEDEDKLYRVWLDGAQPPWVLVSAPDTDHVYRSFRPQKRALIYRVDLVRKTSEVLAGEE